MSDHSTFLVGSVGNILLVAVTGLPGKRASSERSREVRESRTVSSIIDTEFRKYLRVIYLNLILAVLPWRGVESV